MQSCYVHIPQVSLYCSQANALIQTWSGSYRTYKHMEGL